MADGIQAPGGTLGKDAFLQLMVTQMRYQDPLQPMDNSQFLAQLAQFTALEQMTNVAQTESQVLQAVQTLQRTALHQWMGAQVTVSDGQGGTVSGAVEGIRFGADGTPMLQVNGKTYAIDAVQSIDG
ncbi:flagellar hook capping FlgD N-terminal domain-containing protein [Alicyclobacillus sp.]|uniref:flagellar hook capping FlgD N-terminal domain-containing protein n=1 Tax=Alicyclobacillus sp. TaxID=61169 RepID=UPI0025C3CAB8|nr:flagellar hook capping FlgD N-terminal domain-containing protein [Alicyclobacillus sp.]MCL6515633.1 flagellar hook capping protein [Alicyclobacillus sp.]